MSREEINKLIALYQLNELNQQEWKELEHAIESGYILPEDLKDLNEMNELVDTIAAQDTPLKVKDQLIDLIANEKAEIERQKSGNSEALLAMKSLPLYKKELYIRYALAAAALMAGVIIGFVLPAAKAKQNNNSEISSLQKEVHDLRETMMLTLLRDEAPTERLKAVSYSDEFDKHNKTVIEALLNTLNHDDNINVRLAAVDALHKYTSEAWVREQLVKSIHQQESPLVQVALAECMVSIKEKSSIQELQKLVQNKETPDPVKKRIETYIKQI